MRIRRVGLPFAGAPSTPPGGSVSGAARSFPICVSSLRALAFALLAMGLLAVPAFRGAPLAAQEAIDWATLPPAPETDGPLATEVTPATVGMDPGGLLEIDALLDSALADGAAPGAALAIGRRGELVRLRGYGTLDGPGSPDVTPETVWDLASLTKVVGTTTAVMQLVDQGRIELEDRVVDYLPWWRGSDARRAEVTIRDLLLHRAGLPAFRRWFLEMEGRDAYLRAIEAEPLEADPGARTVYSDIGVMTLALVIEEVTGLPLDAALGAHLFDPLGMTDTGFRPPESWRRRIAPTEVDPRRGGKMHGRVHDENADAFGGVAGHAGLFSSARDLAVFAQLLLDGGVAAPCDLGEAGAICRRPRRAPERLLRSATVDRFTTPFDSTSTRAFGWDTPSDERSSASDWFSARSFGHTGYTGTSIWIDPERELFVVLLTNRVNPTRENSRHVDLRRCVHELAVRAITDAPVEPRPGTPSAAGRMR